MNTPKQMKDTRDASYLFFQNGVVCLTPMKVTLVLFDDAPSSFANGRRGKKIERPLLSLTSNHPIHHKEDHIV